MICNILIIILHTVTYFYIILYSDIIMACNDAASIIYWKMILKKVQKKLLSLIETFNRL